MTESIISSSPPPYDTSEDIAVVRSALSTSNLGSASSSPHLLPNPTPVERNGLIVVFSTFPAFLFTGAIRQTSRNDHNRMGIADKTATLFIRGKEFPIGDVLGKSGSRRGGLWDWKFVKHGLFWDCKTNPRKCFSIDRKTLFAIFMPVTPLRKPDTPAELPQLEVTPQGQPFFDDILMSAMIIERWRLTPASGDHKQLFN
ncbi:uncharacterized protein ARMOST_09521 [Armillaria ostoyae]|uniref:Uncharacterized protein n=1 Tax=Armillaria ostoyae TaxID=47428 RepID=A0A284RBS6_ARMOS|nr:uncharacterized protein ARMOST_09521 [Armillaria ostoyae]